jgi:endonuclease/exonuclease/phosphatase family metal-dependent hydrolase
MSRLVLVAILGLGCADEPAPISLLSFNMANGSDDVYRTPDTRMRQAEFIAQSGAQLVALQEVDLNVERSGWVDTARAVSGLDCLVKQPPFSVDGVRRCVGVNGMVIFGLTFHGNDPFDLQCGLPSGIPDGDTSLNPTSVDRSPDSSFGNALLVLGRLEVTETYAVELPTDPSQPADDPLFSALGVGDLTDGERAELGARNLALRQGPAIEPRVVLVTRIARSAANPLSVLVTHLESAASVDLKQRQLERVIAVAKAERAGPPARVPVILGDFNMTPADTSPPLQAAGFVLAAGDAASIDQLWTDRSLNVVSAAEVPTNGVSDHANATRATVR